jgi:uncharacterized OB-fold protein
MTDKPFRVMPLLTDDNRHFWTGGERGELTFLRCQECGYYIHPPYPRCPMCLSKDVVATAVSGRATVASVTVNEQAWNPTMPPPYVLALVEIEEQPSVRLMTNIVNCEPYDVHIGMAVSVVFEEHDPVWIPLFEPGQVAAAAEEIAV